MTDQTRKLIAEVLGTALLVFFACGVAALSFGFKLSEGSISAGVVATAFAFGLVLLALAYSIGPISGAHVNPAVTMGFLVSKRFTVQEAVQYWIAQFVGGIAGAALLYAVFAGTKGYDVKTQGLGADGYGKLSMTHLNAGGAFLAEVILTFLFVYVVLAVTGKMATAPAVAGVAIGIALVAVHLVGIPLTGTSVNPARSLGPALFVRGDALKQIWLFIVAPLVGGALAAVVHEVLVPADT
jgi:aquaporin Z